MEGKFYGFQRSIRRQIREQRKKTGDLILVIKQLAYEMKFWQTTRGIYKTNERLEIEY